MLAATGREASNVRLLENLCRRYVVGLSPFRIEQAFHRLYAYDYGYGTQT